MHAAPQKVVNRAAPVVQRTNGPTAAAVSTVSSGRDLQSPHLARFAGISMQRGTVSEGGKQTFRTSEGQVVELPPDMTIEEAARLEAEAQAAQKLLGKAPPPKPVPDVKKLAKQEGKTADVDLRAKGRGLGRGRGRAASTTRAATAAVQLPAVGKSKVAQYLAAQGTPALRKGIGLLQKLKQNEQTHDNSTQKRQQSEQAVVIPPSDGQSKSNAGQVHAVDNRPVPAVDGQTAQRQLQEALQANTPRSIEDVDNFQRDMKAQHVSADVMQVVQGDKNAVTATFGDLQQTPPPAPPEHKPEALPAEEVAPPTPALNLGQGTIAPLQKEHTDVSQYTREAEGKLQEEGVTQEQLDMVDNGDLAEANREKKGLEKAARTEPAAVQQFARQESERVDKELQQEEKKDRDALHAKRKSGLHATAQKQKGAKSALEKKREEVAGKINGIYKAAQDKVKKKLADLEMQSMKRFDEGSAKATQAFENNVKRELDAYKDDRYSGWFGWARKAKDWLLGMDELPEVKAIFDRNRAAFVSTINQLVDDITADNKRVIQECKDELANAKQAIQEFVDQLEPGLKGIGNKAAAEMNAQLHELDQFIGRKEEELQYKLKDKQTAAIKAIDQKIEKMKEAMSGALAKLGKLLLWAAKKFFTWALQKFGYSLEEIEGIINKGVAVLKAIFTKPIQFVKNLIGAASNGFQNFAKNFLTHLKDAIFDWLTGSLEGIQLPSSWDLKGIASVALQIVGLTWSNIRTKLVRVMGENPVKAMEAGFDLVVTLVKDGPMAAWEKIQEMADEIKAAFVEGVKDFIKIKIVQEAIKAILALFIPGAGIVRAIVGIYDTVVFFIQKAKQIAQMVGNFLSSIGDIAVGNIGAAADALEKGLATALKLVINFLARFLRLDGITAKIRTAIQKLHAKVDGMLDRIVEWIATKAKKLAKFAVTAAKGATGRLIAWWKRVAQVGEGDNRHTLLYEAEGEDAELVIRSSPTRVETFLNNIRTKPEFGGKAKQNAIVAALSLIEDARRYRRLVREARKKGNDALAEQHAGTVDKKFDAIGVQLGIIFATESYGTFDDPIPLAWPGPDSDHYETLYFGGRLNKKRKQSVMKGMAKKKQKDETGELVRPYLPRPRTGGELPGGGKIGLTKFLGKGSIVGPLSTDTTPGGGKLDRLIAPYGYDSTDDGMQLDHVQEIQLGGEDLPGNLWPLESGKNSTKGSSLAHRKVIFPKGQTLGIPELKRMPPPGKGTKKGFYFKITEVRN